MLWAIFYQEFTIFVCFLDIELGDVHMVPLQEDDEDSYKVKNSI